MWNLPVRCLGCCQALQQALYPPSWSPCTWPEQTRDGGGRRFRFLFPDGAVPDYNSRDGSSSSPLFLRRLLCIPFFGRRGLVRPTSTCPGGLPCAAALYINRARIDIILHNTRSCQACLLLCKRAATRPFFRSQSAQRLRAAEWSSVFQVSTSATTPLRFGASTEHRNLLPAVSPAGRLPRRWASNIDFTRWGSAKA